MSGIGVVMNPRSRRNRKDPRASLRLARALGDHGIVREAGSIDELYRIAEDFKKLKIDVLGISGGDGTNHVTLTGFIDVYGGHGLPEIAFLRGGTMNTVANSVGIADGRPEGLLGKLIRAYAERASRPLANVERHVMRIGSHYGFLFGVGAVYGFMAEYYRDGEPTPLVAAKTLLRGIGSTFIGGETVKRIAKPFRGFVEFEDSTVWEERDYIAITAGTIDQMGLNFKPFHRFNEKPNAFHILGIYASPFGLVRQFPRIFRGEGMAEGHAHERVTDCATLHSHDGIMRYMIDGDLHESRGPLRVGIGPKVRIVVDT